MDGSYAVTKQEVSQTGTIRIVREWNHNQTQEVTR
jgi:hypothetical protein